MRDELYSPFNKALVAHMRDARVKARITQREMGELTNRTQAYISKFERGQLRLDVADFILFSKALGLDPIKLLQQLVDLPSAPKVKLVSPDKMKDFAEDVSRIVYSAMKLSGKPAPANSAFDRVSITPPMEQAILEEVIAALNRAFDEGNFET